MQCVWISIKNHTWQWQHQTTVNQKYINQSITIFRCCSRLNNPHTSSSPALINVCYGTVTPKIKQAKANKSYGTIARSTDEYRSSSFFFTCRCLCVWRIFPRRSCCRRAARSRAAGPPASWMWAAVCGSAKTEREKKKERMNQSMVEKIKYITKKLAIRHHWQRSPLDDIQTISLPRIQPATTTKARTKANQKDAPLPRLRSCSHPYPRRPSFHHPRTTRPSA